MHRRLNKEILDVPDRQTQHARHVGLTYTGVFPQPSHLRSFFSFPPLPPRFVAARLTCNSPLARLLASPRSGFGEPEHDHHDSVACGRGLYRACQSIRLRCLSSCSASGPWLPRLSGDVRRSLRITIMIRVCSLVRQQNDRIRLRFSYAYT